MIPVKPYTEEDVANTLAEISTNSVSLKKALKKYNIPPSTLSRRQNGCSLQLDLEV
jgi:hypothetical protein